MDFFIEPHKKRIYSQSKALPFALNQASALFLKADAAVQERLSLRHNEDFFFQPSPTPSGFIQTPLYTPLPCTSFNAFVERLHLLGKDVRAFHYTLFYQKYGNDLSPEDNACVFSLGLPPAPSIFSVSFTYEGGPSGSGRLTLNTEGPEGSETKLLRLRLIFENALCPTRLRTPRPSPLRESPMP